MIDFKCFLRVRERERDGRKKGRKRKGGKRLSFVAPLVKPDEVVLKRKSIKTDKSFPSPRFCIDFCCIMKFII